MPPSPSIAKKSRKCRKCVICNKNEYKNVGGNTFFATFPSDESRCREWIRLVGDPELVYLPIEKLNRVRYVCADHFVRKSFNFKKTRLKKNAVPSLKLPSVPLTDEELGEFPRHIRSHKKVVAIPQTLSSAEQQTLEKLEDYGAETLNATLSEISGNKNYEHDSDSVNKNVTTVKLEIEVAADYLSDMDAVEEAATPMKKEKQLKDGEEIAVKTPYLDKMDAEEQQEPPRWSQVKDVCRACLGASGAWDLAGTYVTEDGGNERLLDMLTLCYGIQLSNVSESSPSRFLCDVCAASLRHADNFRRQVLRAEANFTQYYGPGDIEIKEEYSEGSNEYETLKKEVSSSNNESMEQDSSNTLINTQTSRNITEPPSTVNAFHKKQTKPSVKRSTITASQKHTMSEVSYSEKYIRVISFSATQNVTNSSANKEINIESQPAVKFENNEETNNASHCDEDLLFSDIKRRKNDPNKRNCTQSIITQPEKSTNILQTVKRDSVDLRQLIKVNSGKNVMTIHPLSEPKPKTKKRKNHQ